MLNFFKKNTNIEVTAPLTGNLIKITDVPDEVFSQKMLGDGVAIDPSEGMIVSPCNGKIIQVFPTNHAIGIETKEGIEILIHIGLDTVNLKGKGFKRFVNAGDKVKAGDVLMEIDLEFLRQNVKSLVTPVVITNGEKVKSIEKFSGYVICGRDLIMKVTKL